MPNFSLFKWRWFSSLRKSDFLKVCLTRLPKSLGTSESFIYIMNLKNTCYNSRRSGSRSHHLLITISTVFDSLSPLYISRACFLAEVVVTSIDATKKHQTLLFKLYYFSSYNQLKFHVALQIISIWWFSVDKCSLLKRGKSTREGVPILPMFIPPFILHCYFGNRKNLTSIVLQFNYLSMQQHQPWHKDQV